MERFGDGARVCFVGDSLVAANQTLPRIIDYYSKHFPNENIRFFNCGVSGGAYKGAIEYFYDDILSHDPTHVVVAFGINDSGRDVLATPRRKERLDTLISRYEIFKANARTFSELVLSHGIKLILCTPAPYDEYTDGPNAPLRGACALMVGYAAYIRTLAKELGAELLDYNAYLTRAIETDTEPVFSPDRVHPLPHGYYLIAKCVLENQGLVADEEAPIPEYFGAWRDTVQKLRVVFGAEHMLVCNYSMPLQEKMAKIEKKIEEKSWSIPVLENFARGFIAQKLNQDALYKQIDEIYERDIYKKYSK